MSHFVSAIQLGITTLLLWLVLSRVDLSAVLLILTTPGGLWLLGSAVAVLAIQALVAAGRFVVILPLFGTTCGFAPSLRIWMAGLFVAQTPLTFVAGDMVRIWALSVLGNRIRVASLVVILERALGFLVILLMVLFAVPFLISEASTPEQSHIVWTLTVISSAGVVAFACWPLLPRALRLLPPAWRRFRPVGIAFELASLLQRPLILWRRTALVMLLSLAMHLANIVAVFLLIGYFGPRPDFLQVAAVVVPAMLLMLLPISFAGWGVREGAMAAGLSLLGIPTDRAVATSVAFGLALLIASLPGAVVLLRNRRSFPRRAFKNGYTTRAAATAVGVSSAKEHDER